MTIDADGGEHTINRHIYGHFAEHLGRGIYDGIWSDQNGQWVMRDDVIEALRQIQIPNLRWPGGCFADYYHWRDGIGPVDQRPTIVNTLWGGVTEDNGIGTHEFMALVERLGADPIVVGNVGSGTVQEMADWWEYLNHPGISPMANLRKANGREEPWNVRFWGVGNESWGCGGNMTPEYYADQYKRFATFLRSFGTADAFRIATGPAGGNYDWMEVMMRDAGQMIDGIDLHHYTILGSWTTRKGHATEYGEAEWFELMRRAWEIDDILTQHSAIMDKYDPEKRVWLIVGEWGTWHEQEEGSTPGFLYQQNTIRDAVFAGMSLNVFNQHAERVRMANIAQTVNVLQAMILTRGDQMILTPTYHVFDFYKVHQDATLLPMTFDGGTYEFEGRSIQAVSASASRDDEGRIHITLSNLDPMEGRTINVDLRGADVSRVSGRILTADDMTAHNTFDNPNAVAPATFNGARIDGDGLVVELPAKSVVALELR
ncbi:MAG TPA: alpha-L-arabinofuranosidase C-terminal domain-containing protein [Rhodothermales bacterium]